MARYGGGVEDFNDESAKLRKLRAGREELIRKTEQEQAATESLGEAEVRSTKATNLSRRARVESAEVDSRAARAKSELSSVTNADTAAIERNTAARRKAASASTKGLVDKGAISDFQRYINLIQRAEALEADHVVRRQGSLKAEANKLRAEAAEVRKGISGLQSVPSTTGGTRIGMPSARPAPFTGSWLTQLEKAAANPNFRYDLAPFAKAQIPGLQPRLIKPGKWDIRQELGGQSVFGNKTFKSEADAQAQIVRAQQALARATGNAADSARQVAAREKQAAAATQKVTQAAEKRAAAEAEAAARQAAAEKRAAAAAAKRAAAEEKAAAAAEKDAADAQAEVARLAAARREREAVVAAEVAAREKAASAAVGGPGTGLILHPDRQAGALGLRPRTGVEAYGGETIAEARARGHERARAEAEAYEREMQAQTAFAGRGPGAGIILHPDEQVRRAYAGSQVPKYERVGSPGQDQSYAEAGALQAARAKEAREAARAAGAGTKIAATTAEEADAQRRAAKAAAEHAAALAHLTSAERAYIATLSEERQTALAAQAVDSQKARSAMPLQVQRATAALQAESAALGTVSQAMFKHGALTSEYILATARGETTLRQLGQQAVVTAGKFGGWTIAATALFGAASAIGRIGHGAIQASSGVQQLRRVINNVDSDKAQQSIADLSREFNVPLDVATDAVYRMGQRFHTLPEAVEAARASLYSFKTGEVDVATSSQNLIAIVNGFGLKVSEISNVYDQINQAQNHFSINIGQTEAGLAKAAGTYRNAGGDLNYLLGLFVAISRATSRSGQEIGTAIARTPNFLRRQKSQDFLAALGIDADPRNVQKTIQQAMKYVRENPGTDVRGIAESIFGPQYARQLEPVLRDQTTLNKALKETSPEASKGSAQKELAKVLAETREQITSLGIELERLGAALGRAGAFTFLGLFLKALTTGLGLTTRLVETFDKLPAPIREALVLAAQLGIAIKLLQRFGATERFAGGPLGFLAKPEKQYAVRAKQGMQSYADETANASERAQMESARATQRASLQAAQVQRRFDALEQAEANVRTAPSEEAFAARQKAERLWIASEEELERLNREAAAVSVRASDSRAIAMQAARENTAAREIHPTQMQRYMESQGYAIPVDNVVPNQRGVTTGVHPDELPPIAVPEEFTQKLPRELNERSAAMRLRLTNYYNGLRGIGDETRKVGLTMRTMDRVATGTISAATAATSAVGGMYASAKDMPGKFKGFVAGLGALDSVLLGVVGLSLLAAALDKIRYHVEDAEKALSKVKQSDPKAAQKLNDIAQQVDDHQGVGQQILDTLSHPFDPLAALKEKQKRNNAVQEAQYRQENLDQIHENQMAAATRGSALPQLTYRQAIDRIRKTQQDRRQGLITQRQFDDAMKLHAKEITLLLDPTAQQAASAAQISAASSRALGGLAGYRKALTALKPDELTAEIQAILTTMETFGATGRDWAHLRIAYNQQVSRLAGAKGADDPAGIAALAEARKAMFEGVEAQAKTELDSLGSGGTEAERQAAYGHESQTIRRNIVARARAKLREQQAKVDDARRRAAVSQGEATYSANTGMDPHPAEPIPGIFVGRSLASLQATAKKDHDNLVRLRKSRNIYSDDLRASVHENSKAQAELKDAMFQDRVAGLNLSLQLAQARTDDPITAARDAVNTARQIVALARSKFKPGDRRIRTALVTLLQARKDLTSTISDYGSQLADARDALIVAQAGDDPVAQAAAAQRVAQRQRGRAKNEKERVDALVAMTNANNQMESAITQREAARFDLLSSQTTDPVRQAHLATQSARAALAGASGATDKLTKRADLNRAVQTERDARLEAREGDIEFAKEMGQITNADAIARYRELLKIHTLTKQQRRDIRLKIHQLQSESESEASGFDLNTSGIRLPTIYDVRKAWDPIRRTREAAAHAARDGMIEVNGRHHRAGVVNDVRANISHLHDKRAEVAATVNVYVRDKNAAGEVFTAIDRALGTTVRAQLRSRGMRG